MKSKNQLVEEIASLQHDLQVTEVLHTCGLSYELAKNFVMPDITSGYSMGEIVELYCAKRLVDTVDRRREYAKSCTWRAQHGAVIVRMSRTDLHTYVSLCAKLALCKDVEVSVKLREEQDALVRRCVDGSMSVISARRAL